MRSSIYTVHAPLGISPSPEKFVFVREGFSLVAFLVPFIWLVVYRAWWPLLAYLAVTAGLAATGYVLNLDDNLLVVVTMLVGLYFGFEAAALRQAALRRRGFLQVASVLGQTRIEAEQRYFTLAPPSHSAMTG